MQAASEILKYTREKREREREEIHRDVCVRMLVLLVLPVDERGSFARVPVARRGVGDSLLKRGLDGSDGRRLVVAARFGVVHAGSCCAPPYVVVHGCSRRSVLLLPAPAEENTSPSSTLAQHTHTVH